MELRLRGQGKGKDQANYSILWIFYFIIVCIYKLVSNLYKLFLFQNLILLHYKYTIYRARIHFMNNFFYFVLNTLSSRAGHVFSFHYKYTIFQGCERFSITL